jgi:predicted transcriptional regulator
MFGLSLRILELILELIHVEFVVEELTLSEFILVFHINHHSSNIPSVLIRSVTQLHQCNTLKRTVT